MRGLRAGAGASLSGCPAAPRSAAPRLASPAASRACPPTRQCGCSSPAARSMHTLRAGCKTVRFLIERPPSSLKLQEKEWVWRSVKCGGRRRALSVLSRLGLEAPRAVSCAARRGGRTGQAECSLPPASLASALMRPHPPPQPSREDAPALSARCFSPSFSPSNSSLLSHTHSLIGSSRGGKGRGKELKRKEGRVGEGGKQVVDWLFWEWGGSCGARGVRGQGLGRLEAERRAEASGARFRVMGARSRQRTPRM